MRFLLFILAIVYSIGLIAQQKVTIKDANTKEPLPFATVECFAKAWGTRTDSIGVAMLPDSLVNNCDLVFSYVGYKTSNSRVNNSNTIFLERLPATLEDVTSRNCKEKELENLLLRDKRSTRYLGYSSNSAGVMYCAFVPNAAGKPGIAETLSFGVADLRKAANPNTPIRIRFFEKDQSGLPGEELTTGVLDIIPRKFKWVTVDISAHKVRVPAEGVFVAFEMFDAGPQFRYTVEVKMDDGSKKQVEHYGWFLEALSSNVKGFLKFPGNPWRANDGINFRSGYSPAAGLTISVCKK